MKRFENTTSNIMNPANFLNSKKYPVDPQSISHVINKVNAANKKPKPYTPPKFCQYPQTPRMDEFSFSKGLGEVSLQPAIDQLNGYKEMLITSIKNCFSGMGPPVKSDITLATQAADLLKQIYEAAKCFTQMVSNINRLISTYIQAVNKLVVEVVVKIQQLEAQIMDLYDQLLNTPPTIRTIVTTALLDELDKATNIYEIIKLMGEIENEMNEAMLEVNTLLDSKQATLLHMQANMTLLRNAINSLQYYNMFHSSLKKGLKNAEAMYPMKDDFLDDLNLSAIQASSYNWSITNSAALSEYSSFDELTIIPKLNTLFKNYTEGVSANANYLVISSRTESGYIIVPDLEQGLISAGIDPAVGTGVGFALELSINNGDTIIRAIARGDQVDQYEKYIHRNYGKYWSKAVEKIEYNRILAGAESGQWELFLLNTNTMPSIGTYYCFKDVMTGEPWTFNWDVTWTVNSIEMNKKYYFPVLYKVVNTTQNSVIVEKVDENTLDIMDYVPNLPEGYQAILNPNLDTIPGDISTSTGEYIISAKLKNNVINSTPSNYVVMDNSISENSLELSDKPYEPILMTSSVNGKSYLTINDLGLTNPNDDFEASEWVHTNPFYHSTLPQHAIIKDIANFKIYKNKLHSVILTKYDLPIPGPSNDIPHCGDKIPCLNWSLILYPLGKEDQINKIKFSRTLPTDQAYSFFLKAHWGFIPEQLDVIKKLDAENKAKALAVAKNLLGS